LGFCEQRIEAELCAGLEQSSLGVDDGLVAFGETGVCFALSLFEAFGNNELPGSEIDLSAIGRGSAQDGSRDQGGDARDLDAIDTDLGDGREELGGQNRRTGAAITDNGLGSGKANGLLNRFVVRGVNEEDRFALSSTAKDEDGDTVFGAIHAARKLDDKIKPVMRKGLGSETVDMGRLEQFAS
jgi:hypothetical protein